MKLNSSHNKKNYKNKSKILQGKSKQRVNLTSTPKRKMKAFSIQCKTNQLFLPSMKMQQSHARNGPCLNNSHISDRINNLCRITMFSTKHPRHHLIMLTSNSCMKRINKISLDKNQKILPSHSIQMKIKSIQTNLNNHSEYKSLFQFLYQTVSQPPWMFQLKSPMHLKKILNRLQNVSLTLKSRNLNNQL